VALGVDRVIMCLISRFILSVMLLSAALSVDVAVAQRVKGVVQKELVVGVKEDPPFVIKDGAGQWSGISIELWRAIANQLGYSYRFRELNMEDLLSNVQEGKLDAAVAALTITLEREKNFDFSDAFYVTGLSIAVVPSNTRSFFSVLTSVFSLHVLQVSGLLALVLLFLGFLVWIFERKQNPDQFGGPPSSGIFSGFWWAAVTMTTVGYGDKAPVTIGGRIVALVWMFVGLVAISTFIAAVSSALTVNQLGSRIRGPEDLRALRVATVQDSTAQSYLRKLGVGHRALKSPLEALQALAHGSVDAVVYDEPILRYLILTEFHGNLYVLPNTFDEQIYGLALPPGSQLREPINRALLAETGSPAWHELLIRYLGKAK